MKDNFEEKKIGSKEEVVNYNEDKEYPDLTPEQNEILKEMNHILSQKGLAFFTKRQNGSIELQDELAKRGIKAKDYILFHRAICSTPHNGLEFDTPEHDIENFIRSL